jgi:hypothetical protein
MVFNVEPALYVEGYGGIRHCDMVAVTADGYELFTDFQTDEQSLCLANPSPYEAAATHEIRAVRTNRLLY